MRKIKQDDGIENAQGRAGGRKPWTGLGES